MNSKEFSTHIEELVKNKRGISYMEAVLHFCEKNDIDPATVNSIISKSIRDKIEVEAQNLNYLPKKAKLPGV
jgi:hypothetical protein